MTWVLPVVVVCTVAYAVAFALFTVSARADRLANVVRRRQA
jgi:hypothetical protein